MKKIIVGLLFIITVAGVGAPLVSGLVMEKIVKQSFSNLNTMYADTGSGVSIEIMDYDRKFSSTEMSWKMKLGRLNSIYGVDEIIFVDRAEHGLTGIVSTTSLEKNKWFTELVNNKLAGKNPLTITTEYTFTGQINSTVTVTAFSVPVEGELVEIKAGRAVFSCDKDVKNFSSEASWEGFAVSDKLTVDGVVLSSALERLSTYLWDGTFSFGIEKCRIEGAVEQVELVGYKSDYSFDVESEEGTISIVAAFGADQLLAGAEKVDNGFVRIGVINLDTQGFEEFIKLYTQMANSALQEIAAAENDPEELKTILHKQLARTRLQLMTAFEKLLKKGLEFQVSELYGQLPSGEVKGDAVLSLNKDMTLAQFVPLVHQPELILEIFSLRSDMHLPAQLVGDNPMLLTPFAKGMSTGLFVKEGEKLSHQAETRDGRLYLNGREVQL